MAADCLCVSARLDVFIHPKKKQHKRPRTNSAVFTDAAQQTLWTHMPRKLKPYIFRHIECRVQVDSPLSQPLCSSSHSSARPRMSPGVESRRWVERFDLERCFLSNLHISTAPPEEQPHCPGARISAGKVFKKYMEGKKKEST